MPRTVEDLGGYGTMGRLDTQDRLRIVLTVSHISLTAIYFVICCLR